jgi:hypothetical protein
MGMVKPLPDLSLFPLGCLELCNTDSIGIPLPVYSTQPGQSNYTVQWYDNGNPIANTWFIPPMTLSPGPHNLTITVTGPSPFNCPASAGTFNVFIKECNCKCGEHKLTGFTYAIGNSPLKETKCGDRFTLKCDSLKLNASFSCDSNCVKKVWATMTDQSGNVVQTWTSLPLVYVPSPGTVGTFTITLYGMCDNTICDSCKFTVAVDCHELPPPPCEFCPPEFQKQLSVTVKPGPVQIDSIGGVPFNNLPLSVQISTGTLQITQVIAQVVSVDLTPNYDDCITCDNKPAGWGSLIGQPLKGITPINGGMQILNPGGPNQYLNPKEVVWQSNTPFTMNPASTTMNMFLPALANVPCCSLSGKICIKFTFRDVNCKECEVIVCFSFGNEGVEDPKRR